MTYQTALEGVRFTLVASFSDLDMQATCLHAQGQAVQPLGRGDWAGRLHALNAAHAPCPLAPPAWSDQALFFD